MGNKEKKRKERSNIEVGKTAKNWTSKSKYY